MSIASKGKIVFFQCNLLFNDEDGVTFVCVKICSLDTNKLSTYIKIYRPWLFLMFFFHSLALGNATVSITVGITKLPSPSEIRATFIFDSIPTGIKISINGMAAGVTPYQGFEHRVGEFVAIQLDDKRYMPYQEKITLDSEFTHDSPVVLRPAEGRLLVTMNKFVENAQIIVDGKSVGVIPVKINLPVGLHTLSVRKLENESKELSVNIVLGETKSMMFGIDETGEIIFRGEKINGYTKISGNGQWLDDEIKEWQCVLDNNTGLIWEVKMDDGGLRDKEWKYSREENVWKKNCYNSDRCDVNKYVEDVNAVKLCGLGGWRLPTIFELISLEIKPQWSLDDVNQAIKTIEAGGKIDPNIDAQYFNNTKNAFYWSSTNMGSRVFGVDFFTGEPYKTAFPDEENYTRLVVDVL